MNGKALPPGKLSRLEVDLSASAQDAHAFQPLLESAYKSTTLRLWGLWFFLQFASSGIVLWLPTILQTQFDLSDKRTSRDLLYGVLGQAPGLLLAAFLVERSRRYSLAFFLVCAAATTIGLMFVTSEQEAVSAAMG
jgi:putative MFS transporter